MAQVEFNVPGPGTYLIEADPSLPPLANPGQAGDVLDGEQFYDNEGNPVTGTMPSNPAVSETLEAGESYQVPAGYTPGGTVQAASLASQTPGTATEDDIVQGKTAWVNGVQIAGALEPGTDTGDATATAADILEGETAYVATGKVSGTMPNNGAVTKQLASGEEYNIPAGYHNGSGTVTAPTIASETPGTAVAGDIRQGKTAWVDGEQLTGTVPDVEAATPTISVNAQTGLITAETQQAGGFVTEGTKAASQQMQIQEAQTITPGTTPQTIQANVYLTGAQTILGDENLVPENIKDNVSIFGVTGTYGGGGSTGDFAVPLTVYVSSGAIVTAQNGDTTLVTTAIANQAQFSLTKGGVWNIVAQLNELSAASSVTVQSAYQTLLVFSGEISSIGAISPLSLPRTSLAAASTEDYILFGGGANRTNLATVDSYNKDLTHSLPTPLSVNRARFGAGDIGNFAIFLGGEDASADYYDSSLTRSTLSLAQNRYDFAVSNNAEYLLCGGGNTSTSYSTAINTVLAINSDLTILNAHNLSQARCNLAASTVNSMVIFAGGRLPSSSSSRSNTAEALDNDLTMTVITALSRSCSAPSGTHTSTHALFAGGYSGSYSDLVDVYDSGLTRTAGTPLSVAISGMAGISLGPYGMFAGGGNSSNYFAVVDSYNADLTRKTQQPLSQERNLPAAAAFSLYALFGGGSCLSQGVNSYSDVVDAYTIQ